MRTFGHLCYLQLLSVVALVGCREPSKEAPMLGAARAPTVSAMASQPTLVFDPGNATGCASNSNTCTSLTCAANGVGPCLNVSELVARYGSNSWAPTVAQTLWQLSSEPVPSSDPINLMILGSSPTGSFTYRGQLLQVGSGTIGTFTNINRSGNQPYQVTASGQSGSYWTPFVGDMLVDTTTNSWMWVERDLGTATARITTPMNTLVGSPCALPTIQSMANGDAYVLYDFPKVQIGSFKVIGNPVSYGIIGHLRVVDASGQAYGSIGTLSSGGGMCAEEMAISAAFVDTCTTTPINLFLTGLGPYSGDVGGAVAQGLGGNIGCGAVATGVRPPPLLDGDVLVDIGTELHLSAGVMIGNAYFGTGQVTDTDGVQGGIISLGFYDQPGFYGTAILWGPGGLELHDGTTFVCQHGCTGNLLVPLTIKGGTTAFPWNAASHSWGASTTINAANIDDAGVMGDPPSGNYFRTR